MTWVISFQAWWVDVVGVLCGGLRGWFWLCLGVVVLISGFRVVCVFGRGCSFSLRAPYGFGVCCRCPVASAGFCC